MIIAAGLVPGHARRLALPRPHMRGKRRQGQAIVLERATVSLGPLAAASSGQQSCPGHPMFLTFRPRYHATVRAMLTRYPIRVVIAVGR
jgi:hypothetical protein